MGGGGSAGRVSYPDYIDWAMKMLTVGQPSAPESVYEALAPYTPNIFDALTTAVTTNSPWDGEEAYNPDEHLLEVQEQYDTFNGILELLNESSTIADLMATAKALVEDEILTSENIDAVVQAHEYATEPGFLRDLNLQGGALTAANAVDGMCYLLATGAQMQERRRRLDAARAEMVRQLELRREDLTLQTLNQMTGVLRLRLDASRMAVALRSDVATRHIVAKNDQMGTNLEYDVRGAKWELELINMAGNLLGAPAGTATSDVRSPSKTQQALSGALAGGMIGGTAGMMAFPAAEGAKGMAAFMGSGGPLGLLLGAGLGIGAAMAN